MTHFINFWKAVFIAIGGWIGWLIGEFKPTFPLIIVAIVFIVYDAPDKIKRPAKFTSFAFGKVVTVTIPKRLMLIVLAFLVEHWVFIHVTIPLSYIVTGVICGEQFVSICENEASCNDSESRFWKLLKKLFIDKTERHFDVNLDDLEKEDEE